MSSVVPGPVSYLSLNQAALRSQLCVRTLSRAIRSGRLRAYKIGRLVRIAEPDLQAFMQGQPLRAGN